MNSTPVLGEDVLLPLVVSPMSALGMPLDCDSCPEDTLAFQDEVGAFDEVIMALYTGDNSSLGCAYFKTQDGTLYLSENIPTTSLDLDVAEQFINHAEPTTLLVSARTPKPLLDFLESRATSEPSSQSDVFTIRALGSQEFSTLSAHERLCKLEFDDREPVGALVSMSNDPVPLIANTTRTSGHEVPSISFPQYGSYMDMESHTSINCAGAILGDLHRRRSAGILPDGQRAEVVFHIASLKMFCISNYMFISPEALQALQIIRPELIPSNQALRSNRSLVDSSKGLSVYGLFQEFVCTLQGRDSLRRIFLRPMLDLVAIRERQQSISSLLHPSSSKHVKHAGVILRKLKNVKQAMAQLRKGVKSPNLKVSVDRGIWEAITEFTAQAIRLRELAASFTNSSRIPILSKLLHAILPGPLMALGIAINKVIDFEQSKLQNILSIKSGFDRRLDELTDICAGIRVHIDKVLLDSSKHLSREARKRIQSCSYVPQLGFVFSVIPSAAIATELYQVEDEHGKQWERLYNTDARVMYFKNDVLERLDAIHGNAFSEMGDRETEVVHQLAINTLSYEKLLLDVSDMCGQFDAILALASGAEKYAWVAPQIIDDGKVNIKNGRHPLQELLVPSFIPNDCRMSARHDATMNGEEQSHLAPQALLLTGPNHSGKSVYLKQTAIIIYLAHIGSFVPATEATIGLTDKILTRMSARESVTGNESAFAIDLRQMAQAIRRSTARSLLLVDEFGKGTNNDDGAGLLAAMLGHFLSAENASPRLLIATHFHEVLEGGYIDHIHGLELAHMDVQVAQTTVQTPTHFTYLYKFAQGPSRSSFGVRCAKLNGVDSKIVERAESLYHLLRRNEDIRAACEELSTKETTQLQKVEEGARKFLEATFGEGDNIREILGGILGLE